MQNQENDGQVQTVSKQNKALEELEQSVLSSLATYSNVHRGSGHFSVITTSLYESAREITLGYLRLDRRKYTVIFCTPLRADYLKAHLASGSFHILSSRDFGLPIGVSAVAVKKNALPKGIPFHTGGGTARLVSPGWVVWAKAPDRFEAGTPAIINVIAFAKALQISGKNNKQFSTELPGPGMTVAEILYRDELDKYSGKELLEKLSNKLIGRNTVVKTDEGTYEYVNLDYAASTPTFEPVWRTFCLAWRQPVNMQKEILPEVKSVCSGFFNAPLSEYEIIFTSNTTEAINIAADNFSRMPARETSPVVLNSLLEHTSNELPWRIISQNSLIRMTVDDDGFIDLEELDSIMSEYNDRHIHGNKRITLVAISGASNVLGTVNNLEEISLIVHRHGARLLVDAAQLAAHRKIDIQGTGIDYLAFSAHKTYAPFGSGALIVKKELCNFSIPEMERIRLSGEENIAGIAALGKSLLLLERIGMDVIMEEEQALTAKALRGMNMIGELIIFGIMDPDSPRFASKTGVIIFSLKNIWPDKVARALANKGIGVRYGCHCAHLLAKHILKVSPFLQQFQGVMLRVFRNISLPGVVRISFGIGTKEEDIDRLLLVISKMAKK